MNRQILLEYSNADFKKWANDSELVARFRELKSRIPAGKPEADIGFWIKNKQSEDLAKFLDELVQQVAEKAAKRGKARAGARQHFTSRNAPLEEDIRDAVARTAHGKIRLSDVYKSDQARKAFRRASARDKAFSALGDIDLHNSDYRVAKSIEEVESTPYHNIRVVLPVGTVIAGSGFDVDYPVLVLITMGGVLCGDPDLEIKVDGRFKYIDELRTGQLIDFAWNHGAIFIAEEHQIDPELRKERRSNLGAYPQLYRLRYNDIAADTAIRTHYENGPRVDDPVLPNLISFKNGLAPTIISKNFEATLNAATHTLRKELKKYRQIDLQLVARNGQDLYLAMRIESMESSLNALKDIKAKLRYFESGVDLLTAGLQDINGVISPTMDRSLGSYIKLNHAKNVAKDNYDNALRDWDQAKAIDFLDTKVRRVAEIVNYVTQVTATLDRRVQTQSDTENDLAKAEKKFNDVKNDEIDKLNAQIKQASADVDKYNKQIQDLLNKVKAKRNKLGLKEDIRDAVGKNGVSLTKALDAHNSKYARDNWYDAEKDAYGRKIDYHRSEYIPIMPEEAFKIVTGSEDGYKQVKAVLPINGKSRLVALTNRMHDSFYGSGVTVPDYMSFITPKGTITDNTIRMLEWSEGLMHILKLAHEYGGLWKANIVPRDSETVAKRAQNPESPNFRDDSLDIPRGSNKEVTKRHNMQPYGNFYNGSFKLRMESYNSDLKQLRMYLEQSTQNLETAKQLGDDATPPRESQMAAAQWNIVHYTEELEKRMSSLVGIMEDLMAYKNEAARRRYYDSEKQLQQNISAYKSLTKERAKAISRRRSYEATLGNVSSAQPGDMVDTDLELYDISMEVRRARKAAKLAQKRVIESQADLENFDDIKSSLPRMSQQEINDLFRKVNDQMARYMELEAEMNDFLGKE